MQSDDDVWSMIGHEVRVELDTGGTKRLEVISGHLITRDPVSKCLLIAKIGPGKTFQTVDWIPACSVRKVFLKNERNSEQEREAVLAEFDQYLTNGGGSGESQETMRARGLKIVNYLRSHHLSIVEKSDGVFLIDGTVRFAKPYFNDNFYCDIPIILKRIQKLVKECE